MADCGLSRVALRLGLQVMWHPVNHPTFISGVPSFATMVTPRMTTSQLCRSSRLSFSQDWSRQVASVDASATIVDPSIMFCRLSSRRTSTNASRILDNSLRLRMHERTLSSAKFNLNRNLKILLCSLIFRWSLASILQAHW